MPHTPNVNANTGASIVVLDVTHVAMAVAEPNESPTLRPARMKPSAVLALRPHHMPKATHRMPSATTTIQPVATEIEGPPLMLPLPL